VVVASCLLVTYRTEPLLTVNSAQSVADPSRTPTVIPEAGMGILPMRITRGVLGATSLCVFLVSCGTPESGPVDVGATVREPVLSGTTDITENFWGPFVFQAETDSIVTVIGHR
jgi:hypothetical protein